MLTALVCTIYMHMKVTLGDSRSSFCSDIGKHTDNVRLHNGALYRLSLVEVSEY